MCLAGRMLSSMLARSFQEAILQYAPATATLHNSASLTLEEVLALLHGGALRQRGGGLQSGDLSLYSAMQEQITWLEAAGIAYEVIPGISAFKQRQRRYSELTIPEVVQTIILTRGTKTPCLHPGISGLVSGASSLALSLFERAFKP